MSPVLEAVPGARPIPYRAPEAWRMPIGRALRDVVDPELALGIVDLGLVYAIEATGQALRVQVTMTSAACPVADLIVADLEEALGRGLPPGTDIAVDVTWDPPWTPDRMSERAWRCMNG